MKIKRTRLWVDASMQGSLLLRMVCYLVAFAFIVWHIGFAFAVTAGITRNGPMAGADSLYADYLGTQRPLLYAFVLTAPVLLYDMLRFSNRIAGPLYRCRRMMDEMAAGKVVAKFMPRQNDFLGDFFQSFNNLIDAWNVRVGPTANPPADPSGRPEL